MNSFSFSYKNTLKIVRILDSTFMPEFLTFEIGFTQVEKIEEENIEEICQNTFIKIDFFIKTVLDNAIFVEHIDPLCEELLMADNETTTVDNTIVLCPSPPTDTIIALLLLSKLKTISNAVFDVKNIKLGKLVENHMTVEYDGNPATILPTKDQWVSNEGFSFDKSWWERDDISTFDAVFETAEELETMKETVSYDNFFGSTVTQEKNNVIRPQFTVITNDKL